MPATRKHGGARPVTRPDDGRLAPRRINARDPQPDARIVLPWSTGREIGPLPTLDDYDRRQR